MVGLRGGWSFGGAGPNNDRTLAGEVYIILAHARGDVSCDGLLDARDSLAILKAQISAASAQSATSCPAVGSVTESGLVGDLNRDGRVDGLDALDDLRVIAGLPALATGGTCPPPNATYLG